MSRSIMGRLFIIVFLSFGLLLSSWIFWIHNDTEKILIEQKSGDLDQVLDSSSDYLKLYSENITTALINLSTGIEQGNLDEKNILSTLKAFQKENSNRIQVAVCILPGNRVLCSKQYIYEIFGGDIYSQCYQAVEKAQYLGIRWTEPYTSTITLSRTMALYKPVVVAGRRAVIVVEIDLAGMLSNFMNGSSGTVWAIVSQRGNVVTMSYDYLASEVKASLRSSRDNFENALQSIIPQSGALNSESIFNDTEYLLRSKKNVCLGWDLLAFTPKKSLYDLISPLTQRILVLGLIHLFVLAIVITIFGRHYTRPIAKLAQKLKTTPSPLELSFEKEIHGSDEVSVLAKSLQSLINRIRVLMHEQIVMADQKRMLEINALQAQIRPHFLGNTLACIESLLKEGQWQEVQDSLHALIKLLNYSIARTDAMVPLRDELACLESYVALRHMRSQNAFDYATSIPVAHLDHLVPRLFLQPIVENSIVHGFPDIPRRGRILVISYEHNGKLFLAVSDNGQGISREKLARIFDGTIETSAHSHGIGVHNVIQRLGLNYSDSNESSIENNSDEGVRVTLDLGAIHKER